MCIMCNIILAILIKMSINIRYNNHLDEKYQYLHESYKHLQYYHTCHYYYTKTNLDKDVKVDPLVLLCH